jgi:iron-sulfur cluster repair protein YtfE (RIC family)
MNRSLVCEPSISFYFEREHDRLDSLFQDYQRLKPSDFPRARECFLQFEFGLRRHIAWEEEILFTLFEEKTDFLEYSPVATLRDEHREILQALEALKIKILGANPNSIGREKQFLILLGNHNLREESVLFPMIDEVLDQTERSSVFDRMRNSPIPWFQPDFHRYQRAAEEKQ